jgi:hypothetical protein
MGKYINQDSKGNYIGTSFDEKLLSLVEDGAVQISTPKIWEEGLICLVDNYAFSAAGYAYDEREMEIFKDVGGRPFQWLKMDNAKELAK